MAIRRRVEFDGQKYHGYVEYGIENFDNDSQAEAKDALVFLLVCINDNWKIPVGYFLTNGVNAEQKANLVKSCLSACHDAGIKIISITFDGAASNMAMMNKLGCNLEQEVTYFLHPEINEKIYFYPDPCHMIKNVRNAFGDKKVFLDEFNRKICWKYIELLQEIQEKECFHLANKLKHSHVQYKKQIMKVRLATQLLSESTATALQYCANELRLENFANCEATVEFIKIFNNLFDIFNSKSIRQYNLKKALCDQNVAQIFKILDNSRDYIKKLKCEDGSSVLLSSRKTAFVGFLICINSLKELYSEVTQNKLLKYIPTYKMNQDHIEILFSVIRAKGGFNNNPSAQQFKSAYKKILIHTELHSTNTGNCIPLEHISILHCSSANKTTNSINIINMSSGNFRIAEEEHIETYTDHDYCFDPQQLTEFSLNIITYISGFVVRFLKKKIFCDECVQALEQDPVQTHKNEYFRFVILKDKGNLIYPSNDVIDICKICEKIFKNALTESGGKYLKKQFSILFLTSKVLKHYINKIVFKNLLLHSTEQNVCENHIIQLIRAIAEKYLSIRIQYITKKAVNKDKSERQRFNKLVLFAGN